MKAAASLTVIAAVLALGACDGRKAAVDATPAPVAAEDGALAPGVWETTVSGEGAATMAVRTCVDAANAKPTMGTGQCGTMKRTLTGLGVWSIEASCGTPPITMTGEMRGDLSSAYTLTVTANAPAGVAGKEAQTMSLKIEAKKVADTCPAELPPGAIETPQGIIDSSGVKAP